MLGCTVLADPGINYPLSNINTVPHHSGQRGHGAAIVHSASYNGSVDEFSQWLAALCLQSAQAALH